MVNFIILFFKFFLQNKCLTGNIFLPSLIFFQSISLLLPLSLNILISLMLHLSDTVILSFITRKNATKKENIGVENASDEAISHIISFDNLKKKENNIFTMTDLMENGLCSGKNSKEKRIMLGNILNIGYYNSKQFSHALNSFNITKEEFQRAMSKIK